MAPQLKARVYPFTALVAQDEMRAALMIAAVDPTIGGVLVLGDRGTGKSTAVRSLAALLPPIEVMEGCPFGCDPAGSAHCESCEAKAREAASTAIVPVPMVDLPLGATEDRVLGCLDLERALTDGVKTFQPGLLARANRGFLYIDEVNLLEDHLVDLLIDVAASGINIFERDGLSVRHPARFVMVGSGNPEEGELRPQLLDRFGLQVEVRTPEEVPLRVEIVKRRDAFERDPASFVSSYAACEQKARDAIVMARLHVATTKVPDSILEAAARLCVALGTDGVRGELTLMRTARALAALEGCSEVTLAHLRQAAPMALRHRLRRDPLDDTGSTARVLRAVEEQLGK
ncbi:MAG: magnesium chelatase ATPase subunit I [Proteobacteria bacterium]|nr:magnesium chelatase ATPase subunit I [Pseudomonadota bacterium]